MRWVVCTVRHYSNTQRPQRHDIQQSLQRSKKLISAILFKETLILH